MNGTLVFDEILCDITDITFRSGRLWMQARSRTRFTGTVDAYAEFTVFDTDGTLVCHVPSVSTNQRKHKHKIRDGVLYVEVPFTLDVHDRIDGNGKKILV